MKERILRLFNLYTEKDLVGFAAYCLSPERKHKYTQLYSRIPLEDRLGLVHNEDLNQYFNG